MIICLKNLLFLIVPVSLGLISCEPSGTKEIGKNTPEVGISEVKEIACNCPDSRKSSIIYHLEQGHKVIACSSIDSSDKDSIFSYLLITHCNTQQKIDLFKSGSTKISSARDTLFITQLSDFGSTLFYSKNIIFIKRDTMQSQVMATEKM